MRFKMKRINFLDFPLTTVNCQGQRKEAIFSRINVNKYSGGADVWSSPNITGKDTAKRSVTKVLTNKNRLNWFG